MKVDSLSECIVNGPYNTVATSCCLINDCLCRFLTPLTLEMFKINKVAVDCEINTMAVIHVPPTCRKQITLS